MATVRVVYEDDEHIEVQVDGKGVAWANHDEHGWSGMDSVIKTAFAVARALGVEVVE
jgi:DNA gyrase/topoisomerase IV subunit B